MEKRKTNKVRGVRKSKETHKVTPLEFNLKFFRQLPVYVVKIFHDRPPEEVMMLSDVKAMVRRMIEDLEYDLLP